MHSVLVSVCVLAVVLGVCGGPVVRDPVSGMWIPVSENDRENDPRFRDPRAPPLSSTPESSSLVQTDASSTPESSRVWGQTDAGLIPDAEAEALVQTEAGAGDRPVVVRSHMGVPAGPQLSVRVRVMGEVCRFQGYLPISGCPIETTNSCTDRIPCSRSCAADGYYRYRCMGSQLMSPEDLARFRPTPTPIPPLPKVDDRFISDLSGQIRSAITAGDYNTLARLMISAQGLAPSLASVAANALAQIDAKGTGTTQGAQAVDGGVGTTEGAEAQPAEAGMGMTPERETGPVSESADQASAIFNETNGTPVAENSPESHVEEFAPAPTNNAEGFESSSSSSQLSGLFGSNVPSV